MPCANLACSNVSTARVDVLKSKHKKFINSLVRQHFNSMNYLTLLEVISDTENILLEIEAFETARGESLPILYRTFLLTFETSNIGQAELLQWYSEKYDKVLQFYDAEFLGDSHVNIIKFFKLNYVLEFMSAVYADDDESIRDNYIAIGECNDQGVLLLGIGDGNRDEVFIEYRHSDIRVRKIGENIFDFFQRYQVVPNASDLPDNVGTSSLYRKWGEDFWRVDFMN